MFLEILMFLYFFFITFLDYQLVYFLYSDFAAFIKDDFVLHLYNFFREFCCHYLSNASR